MTRRSRGSGKKVKARRREAEMPKRDATPKLRRRSLPAAAQETELARRTRERDEALEQFSATSEVLRVISASAGELDPVFQAMLENATRICEAKFGILWLCEGEEFRAVALHGVPPEFAERRRRQPVIRPTPGHTLDRMKRSKQVVHIADILADQSAAGPLFANFSGVKRTLGEPLPATFGALI
jgi:hypothetical protein